MFNVHVHVWVPFSTINFEGNAELRLHTYEAQLSIDSCPELCVAVEQKFGKDLYLLTIDFGTPSYEFTVNICTDLIF
jgi:hypothetical protein